MRPMNVRRRRFQGYYYRLLAGQHRSSYTLEDNTSIRYLAAEGGRVFFVVQFGGTGDSLGVLRTGRLPVWI